MGCILSVSPSPPLRRAPRKRKRTRNQTSKRQPPLANPVAAINNKRPSDNTQASSSTTVTPKKTDRSSTSIGSTNSDEYIDRCTSSIENDGELSREIAKRQNSMVRSHINRFDQLEAMSKIQKPLREVTDFPLRKDSAIYERVQSFERIGRDNQIERQLNLGGLNRRWQGSEEDTFPDEVPAAPVPVLFTM